MRIKLGVMFGGETVEHEVSIISALQAIQNLNNDKLNFNIFFHLIIRKLKRICVIKKIY